MLAKGGNKRGGLGYWTGCIVLGLEALGADDGIRNKVEELKDRRRRELAIQQNFQHQTFHSTTPLSTPLSNEPVPSPIINSPTSSKTLS